MGDWFLRRDLMTLFFLETGS